MSFAKAICVTLFLAAFAALAGPAAETEPMPSSPFGPEQTHCAAWRAKKRMLLVRSLEPVGTSCRITARWHFDGDTGKAAELRIPVTSFDSGEKDRDAHVARILGDAEHSDVVVTTESFSNVVWDHIWDGHLTSIPVKLQVKGKSHPLELRIKVKGPKDAAIVHGVARASLSALGLEVPPVAGGLVAKVSDAIELHVQLDRLKFKSQD